MHGRAGSQGVVRGVAVLSHPGFPVGKRLVGGLDFQVLEDVAQGGIVFRPLDGMLADPGNGHPGTAHLLGIGKGGAHDASGSMILHPNPIPLSIHSPLHIVGQPGNKPVLGGHEVNTQGAVPEGFLPVSLVFQDHFGETPALGAGNLFPLVKVAESRGQRTPSFVRSKPEVQARGVRNPIRHPAAHDGEHPLPMRPAHLSSHPNLKTLRFIEG